MRITVSQDVQAPPDVVWAVITDLAAAPTTISSIESVEIISGGSPLAVGTTWRETRRVMGRSSTEEMTVSAVDPGRSYTVVAHSSGADFESTLSVAPAPGGSRLAMTMTAQGTNALTRVLGEVVGRLLSGSNTKALTQDLTDMARAAKARAGGGSDQQDTPTTH